MGAPTFDLVRPTVKMMEKPTLPFAASMIPFIDPTSALRLQLGEWLTRGATAADELSRPPILAHAEYTLPAFPYWEWSGQTDVQVSQKGSIIVPIPGYEAWTLLWDSVTSPPTAYGDPLCVTVMAPGEPYAGYATLRKQIAGGFVIGYALNPIPAAAGSNLYFKADY